jgi:hypothetical protein
MKKSRKNLLVATAAVLTLSLNLTTPNNAGAGQDAVLPPFHTPIFFPVEQGGASRLPGATLLPDNPVFDFEGIPGWIQGKKYTNQMGVTIPKYEILVIKGSRIRDKSVTIPAGGIYFDSSPARGEVPMTGSADYFLGKKYYFVDYQPKIVVKKDTEVDAKHWTAVGNHLYRLLSPPVPKVVPNPVLTWRTYDGVSIRPWAVTQRWQKSGESWANQTPMTYLQGVISSAGKTGVRYRTLSGTAISREWWATRKDFFGDAREGQTLKMSDGTVTINAIHPGKKGGTVSLTLYPAKGRVRHVVLRDEPSPSLPESSALRHRMIAIDGPLAVVLWPKGAVNAHTVKLWIYGNVRELKTNASFGGLKEWNYFPIACPIAHHIGGMIYNSRPLKLSPGQSVPLFGRYAWLKLVSVQGQKVLFEVGSHNRWTPLITKSGNIDSVFGEGRAVHGILSTLDSTRLDLDPAVSTVQKP